MATEKKSTLELKEFQERVMNGTQGLKECFLHCCIGKSEKFCALVNDHIHFQTCSVVEGTEDYMILELDYGSFKLRYKLSLIAATCNVATYNKRISAIDIA